MVHAALDDLAPAKSIDDCWNRIGTRGDGSCPRLAEHTRCLNCPVFEHAAAKLLDRPLTDADLAETAHTARTARTATRPDRTADAPTHTPADDVQPLQSALAFRIADEWLALPAAVLRQIDGTRPIHPLPHRRNGVVLGLVNVRGTLTIAASLGAMLNLDRDAAGRHASRTAYARMLVVEHRGDTVALPVDEVEGVLRFAASALLPVPTTLTHAAAMHARGLLAWRDTTIGLLDTDRVFDSLARSLR